MEDDALKPKSVQQTVLEPPVAKQDDAQATPRAIGGLLKANTSLAVWFVFLALGGGILSLYYARIGYLPDIEWSSSLVYLAAASFIGGGVGLLLALSVFLPGLIWGEFLVFDTNLGKVLCYEENGEPCLRSIWSYVGIPFAVILLIAHVALIKDWLFYTATPLLLVTSFLFFRCSFTCLMSRDSTLACTKSLWKLYLCIFKRGTFRYSKVSEGLQGESERRIFKGSSWFTLSVLLSQISMFVVYRLSGKPGLPTFAYLTVICTGGVLISNHVVAVLYRYHPRKAIAASLVAAALLLFAADRFSSLSQGIMARYGFGAGNKVTLFVTDEGDAIIENLKLQRCEPPTSRRLCNVEILSKIGSEYFLEVGGRRFTLPKEAVQGYASE